MTCCRKRIVHHGRCLLVGFVTVLLTTGGVGSATDRVLPEPVELGHEPHYVFDNHVIDNHWTIKYKRQAVQRVFHQATKHSANPLLGGDQPSFLWVIRDDRDGMFRMWYQANFRVSGTADRGGQFQTQIAYAESKDGIHWDKPHLNLFGWHDVEPNNIVLGRADFPQLENCAPCLLKLPQADCHGYRYVMMYRSKGPGGADVNGIRLIGSQDGIHWDAKSDRRIAQLPSDCHNTIVFDPARGEYVLFCRAKHIYRTSHGAMIDTGASRRVARLSSKTLWTDWLASNEPQTILIPDEIDNQTNFNFFYGMPTRYNAGVYWGFLEPFRMNDFIYTELAVSRDGVHFDRLPGRPKLIPFGPEDSWDDTMIFASPSWVEMGDEWWIYYAGWDGPHGTADRTGAIGLATIRKEGFLSMRGPHDGGVLCTRQLRWPGGMLVINANAKGGAIRVRVSDVQRSPCPGFDYADCETFSGDSVAHPVTWHGQSLDVRKGQVLRFEFFLQDADLYTFRAEEN